MKICISSGHGLKVRGATGISDDTPWGLDEVDEARKVVPELAKQLRKNGHEVLTFNDDTSTTQDENLRTITAWHNSNSRELDISVHFNCYDGTANGTECLYVTQEDLAATIADTISEAIDVENRGAKYRSDLYVLNNTTAPCVLIEVVFCDHEGDCDAYREGFDKMCEMLGEIGHTMEGEINHDYFVVNGKVSWFGGPNDTGVDSDEGLAFIYDVETAPYLFLDEQPPGTTGLARRLDPSVPYFACRFDYDQTPKEMLAGPQMGLVIAKKNGRRRRAWPADWGPHSDTDRVSDISPGLMQQLGITTDDEVVVIYPAPGSG